MKKVVIFLLVLVMASGLFASDLHFLFKDLGQHPDFLGGFLPTYLLIGAGYDLPDLIDGNKTQVQLLVGDGYTQRLMWLDKDSGANNFDNDVWNKDNALRFNVWQNELSLRFIQGFMSSPVGEKDLLTLTLNLTAKYERYYSSSKFLFFNIGGNFDEIIDSSYDGKIYPELNGGKDFLGGEIALNLKLDMMEDTLHTNNGIWSGLDVKVGPSWLNRGASGHASYISVISNTVGARTFYNLENAKGDSMFSISLADRFNASFTTGDAVPSYIQGPVSLGRKVRGFNTYTYATEFSVVNNFDIRFAGPDLGVDGIAPRINLFIDCGYGWGKVFNTERKENNLLASCGVQIEMSFFDIIDLGYEVNYLLVDKDKYTQAGRKITTNFTFFLDF